MQLWPNGQPELRQSHAPAVAIDTLARWAWQGLSYVLRSQPQTGIGVAPQSSGTGWQVPDPGIVAHPGVSQNCPAPHDGSNGPAQLRGVTPASTHEGGMQLVPMTMHLPHVALPQQVDPAAQVIAPHTTGAGPASVRGRTPASVAQSIGGHAVPRSKQRPQVTLPQQRCESEHVSPPQMTTSPASVPGVLASGRAASPLLPASRPALPASISGPGGLRSESSTPVHETSPAATTDATTQPRQALRTRASCARKSAIQSRIRPRTDVRQPTCPSLWCVSRATSRIRAACASMGRLSRRIESIVPRRAHGFGGKASNLAALARAGFPVPAAYALPAEAFRTFVDASLPERDRPAALLAEPAESVSPERLASIREVLARAPLGRDVSNALRDALSDLERGGARAVAVRSSSTNEDRDAASAAGLHSTVLQVRNQVELERAVRLCWASFFEPRVLAYLRTMGRAAEASMGVVVQAMVPADVSGVLFTVNPLTGDAGEMVLNAAWGLGSSVVDGRVSPDTWRIDKASGFVRDRVIGHKRIRVIVDAEGGVRDEPLDDATARRECLDEHTLAALVELGRRIEAYFGDARDVEWSVAGGVVYVLQARPVTTLVAMSGKRSPKRRKAVRSDRARMVWSNVNVGEALPGVATPFTWSVLSAFSELGFRRAFGALGCSVPADAELVGNFRGRIYLNLTEFCAIAAQVPGLRPRTLLSLAGGAEAERLERESRDTSHTAFLLRLPLTITRFARENARIGARVQAFERSYADEAARMRAVDLRILTPLALEQTLGDVERLLDTTGAVMLTCYGNLLASVVTLRAVLSFVAQERADVLERGLLTGLADVESAAPGLSLWHIAEMARAEPAAQAAILGNAPAGLRLESLPEGPTRRALGRFLDAYGHRGPREAEIAEPRWREDPTLLFATLRVHLQRAATDGGPLEVERRQRLVRAQSEADLDRLLPFAARTAARHLLALVQRFMRLRERLRGRTVEVLGFFRAVCLDASRRIEVREPAAGKDAAFFLTIEEVHRWLRGEVVTVAPLVRQRRAQYARDRALPDPPDTFVGFPPPPPPLPAGVDVLTGLAASSGHAEGLARVVSSPAGISEFRSGEILVAPYADVGWSPIFLAASAVVTDLGGPLSHAAIVAREYGVPSVVNVRVGTQVIRTGDRLVVDGDAGTVRIVERAPRPSVATSDVTAASAPDEP